jgi:hypothetical protein
LKSAVEAARNGIKANFDPHSPGFNHPGEGWIVNLVRFVKGITLFSAVPCGPIGLPAGRLCILCVNALIFFQYFKDLFTLLLTTNCMSAGRSEEG